MNYIYQNARKLLWENLAKSDYYYNHFVTIEFFWDFERLQKTLANKSQSTVCWELH